MEKATIDFEVSRDSSGTTFLTIIEGSEIRMSKDSMPVATPQGKVVIRKSTIKVGAAGVVQEVSLEEPSQARALVTIGNLSAKLKEDQRLADLDAQQKMNQIITDHRNRHI
jgi:hypothetical protein